MRWLLLLIMACVALPAHAELVEVKGGKTNIFLDGDVLATLGISIVGVEGAVDAVDGYNVAYPITPPPVTTFTYTAGDFAPFSGSIEHTGTLQLDVGGADITVGNFSIGFDAIRAEDNKSGFFVESTVGFLGILFDVQQPDLLEPGISELVVRGRLLLAQELANALNAPGVAGLDVGEALIQAVPEPSSILLSLFGAGLAAAVIRRRRAS